MGKIVGEEMKQTGMIWNFSPCVAAAQDPRWGRTYESYSSNLETVTKLSTAYIKGLVEAGVMPCVKHFIADGNEAYGTGEDDKLMDRGDATLNEEQINDLLNVYKECIASGANTVMINHGSINGVKLHENKELITDKLKGEMGFQGMVVSDWESIHNISGENLEEQTIIAINAGIDMLMEPERYGDCRQYIIDAVNSGRITMERVDDAVYRILSVKKQMGVLDDPMQENVTKEVTEVGTDAYREVARQLVEKSLVLLKNEDSVLPLKKGMKIFVTGPAANDTGVQCGGWTVEWLGGRDNGGNKYVEGATTILEGLEAIAEEYDLTIITEEAQASEADITLLCIGEQPYAEWYGDTEDLSITGALGLPENEEAIELAKNLGKKTVTLLVAGRNVIFDEYSNDWDAVVMCYLPGSEADGVANVLCGKSEFAGKLAMPWYKSVEDIDKKEYLYDIGYGLTYDSLK